jgi:EmrB/QacA subfamily drug resistance transporter
MASVANLDAGRSHRPTLTAYIVAGAFFMEFLDGTILVPALPDMARAFGVAPVDLNIGISAYLMTVAVLLPVSGWIADRFGGRTVLTAAIVIFTAASVLCGMSESLGGFTGARILQGVGGALMVPVGRLIVLRVTAKGDLMRAIALITWPGLAAPVLGPPLGGLITTYAAWPWIFFVNLPLGLAAIVLALIFVRDSHRETSRRFDWLGFGITSAACFAFIYGCDRIAHVSGNLRLGGGALAASAILGVVAVRHARYASEPLLDLSVLRFPTFAAMLRAGFIFRTVVSAIPFLLPLMFQVAFGLSPVVSGFLLLALFAGNLGIKPLTSRIIGRFGFRATLIGNGVLFAVTTLACAFLSPDTPLAVTALICFLGGVTRSMQFTANFTLAYGDVPHAHMSAANTLVNMMTQIGWAFGIALAAIALRIADLVTENSGLTLSVLDFQLVFTALAGCSLFALIDCIRLESAAGDFLIDRSR